jgi:hypothetical protein
MLDLGQYKPLLSDCPAFISSRDWLAWNCNNIMASACKTDHKFVNCHVQARYCGGVKWAAPEKSPDLGNSSPAPRALMYIASLWTSVRDHHQDDRAH